MAKSWFSNNKGWVIPLGLVLLIIMFIWSSYNGIVTLQVNVENEFANVDTQLQRRFDLIPNLVSTVEGIRDQERDVFTTVTEMRTAWASAATRGDKIAAAQGLEGALSRLLVTVENYPNLVSQESFNNLMIQLEGTENRISVARTRYNDAVRAFNTKIRRFPANMIAGMFGFQQESFFEAVEGAEAVPQVDFS